VNTKPRPNPKKMLKLFDDGRLLSAWQNLVGLNSVPRRLLQVPQSDRLHPLSRRRKKIMRHMKLRDLKGSRKRTKRRKSVLARSELPPSWPAWVG
jgi:hypothetical protein